MKKLQRLLDLLRGTIGGKDQLHRLGAQIPLVVNIPDQQLHHFPLLRGQIHRIGLLQQKTLQRLLMVREGIKKILPALIIRAAGRIGGRLALQEIILPALLRLDQIAHPLSVIICGRGRNRSDLRAVLRSRIRQIPLDRRSRGILIQFQDRIFFQLLIDLVPQLQDRGRQNRQRLLHLR